MENWMCLPCGYIYDPEVGDDNSDIAPDVKFKDLPENWVCPLCGALKENFEKVR